MYQQDRNFEAKAQEILRKYELVATELSGGPDVEAAQSRMDSFTRTLQAVKQQLPQMLNTLKTRQEYNKQLAIQLGQQTHPSSQPSSQGSRELGSATPAEKQTQSQKKSASKKNTHNGNSTSNGSSLAAQQQQINKDKDDAAIDKLLAHLEAN